MSTAQSQNVIGTVTSRKRFHALMPDGIPKYVRCYDNGGESADRYTVVFTGKYRRLTGGEQIYIGMNAYPFHPQGIGQRGSSANSIDVNKGGFAPAIGRKNHLGKRIAFTDLPIDCQTLVKKDYRELWNI